MTPKTTHVPSADGVRVAVTDYGGSGTPILFVHGTGMCGRMWEPVIAKLPATDFRMLTVDLRGHGLTHTPPGTTFYDHRMVADLAAVVDAFDVTDGGAVAHSMGAGASILTSIERPDALRRIWGFEPIIFPKSPEGIPSDFVEGVRRRRTSFASRAEAFERYSSRPPLDELSSECLRAYVDYGFVDQDDGTVSLACHPADEATAFGQFLQDGFDRLGDVKADVLVAYGSDDDESPPATLAPTIAEAIPNGTLEEFARRRHFGPFADQDYTARSVMAFMS